MRLLFLLVISCSAVAQSLETIVQQGHELAVVAVDVSADSAFVATGSKDKSAKVWELKTGRELRSFLGHEATVSVVKFTPDARYLITGSRDYTTRIWEVATGKELFSLPSPTESFITSIATSPDARFIIAAGYSSVYSDTALVYELSTRKIVQKIPVNPDKGLGHGVGISWSADGKWVGIGEDNRVANIYRTSDWKLAYSFEFKEGWCGGCATKTVFSPDSKWLYMVSHNGSLKKYNLANGRLEKNYADKIDDLTGFAISANGKRLGVATEKWVKIWDEVSGALLDSLEAVERGDFHQIAFTPDNAHVLIACDDNTAFTWSLQKRKKAVVFTGVLNERDKGGLNYDANFVWQAGIAKYIRFKNQLMITNDGKQLLKGKFGTKVKRWDIASGQSVMEYGGHKKAVLCYDISKDGKLMLTGGGDGKVILWDVMSGDSLRVFHPHREPVFDIQFSNDESLFACSSWDATMRVYDLKSGKSMNYWDFQNNSIYNLTFHPSDLYLFTASLTDFTIQMYELDTRNSVRSFVGHTDLVSSLTISSDQQHLLTSSWDGSIRLWNIATGLMVKKFKDHRGAVHKAIFSPDGKYIYSAGADRSIRVWDIASGTIAKRFDGHRAEVTSLLFSPDAKMLISHSVDGVTKFWDLNSGKEFFEHIHLGERDWMVKSPDGYFNGTNTARQHIHFVDGLKTYSVDQFFDAYYRPDLLPELFRNRRGNDSQNLQGKLQSSPPPSVRIATVNNSDPAKVDVYVRLSDAGDGVDNLRLFHNDKGIPIDRSKLNYPSGKDQAFTYKQTINLVSGTNTFKALAGNKSRIDSEIASTEVQSDILTKNSVCYVLAVGINQYKNSRLNLNYATPDAQSFVDILDDKSNSLFGKIELHTLYDTDASRSNILKKLDELSGKIHAEDVFIFYYAGHGSMVDNSFFFIPSESLRLYDLGSLKTEALEASVLQEKFRSIKALKQLIVMDACQSGGSVELLANRGAAEEKAIAQLSRSAGIHVMASAGSEQFAAEFTELGHGLFTYVLIEALRGAADGAPKDGKVTIYELKSYLDDQVPEMTRKLKGKPQYPFTFSRGQDFPILIKEQ